MTYNLPKASRTKKEMERPIRWGYRDISGLGFRAWRKKKMETTVMKHEMANNVKHETEATPICA